MQTIPTRGEVVAKHPSTPHRSYRCHYTPLDINGYPVLIESGLLPFVQVKAASAEQAIRAASATIRGPVSHVERLEEESIEVGP